MSLLGVQTAGYQETAHIVVFLLENWTSVVVVVEVSVAAGIVAVVVVGKVVVADAVADIVVHVSAVVPGYSHVSSAEQVPAILDMFSRCNQNIVAVNILQYKLPGMLTSELLILQTVSAFKLIVHL